MGRSDYYASGDWNFYCDFCGAKEKTKNSMLTWDGYRVCKHHKEIRNPQDFIRGVKDDQTTPWSRPEAPEQFIPLCRLEGRSAMPGLMMPGCAIPSIYFQITITTPPSFCGIMDMVAQADIATADCAIVGV